MHPIVLLLTFQVGSLAPIVTPPPYVSPRSFPDVPRRVTSRLEKVHCKIPQAIEADRPNNIIRGRFMRAGQMSWAALCSIGGESSIVILTSRGEMVVKDLDPRIDSDYRLIMVAKPDRIRAADRALGNPEPLPALDHDGIDDIITGKASTIHYFHRGRWLELAGSD